MFKNVNVFENSLNCLCIMDADNILFSQLELEFKVENHVNEYFDRDAVRDNTGQVIDDFFKRNKEYKWETHHDIILDILTDKFCNQKDENKNDESIESMLAALSQTEKNEWNLKIDNLFIDFDINTWRDDPQYKLLLTHILDDPFLCVPSWYVTSWMDNKRAELIENSPDEEKKTELVDTLDIQISERNSDSEDAEYDESKMLDTQPNMVGFLKHKEYDFTLYDITILNEIREALAVFDVLPSNDDCACGARKINGHGCCECEKCVFKGLTELLLSPKYKVINNINVFNKIDKYYEEYEDMDDRWAALSVGVEKIALRYLGFCMKLIGANPTVWLFLQGDPVQPEWCPKRTLDYLKYFRSKSITGYMVFNYGGKS